MARYLGPKCKLSRREGTDLFLKSSVRPLESKCKADVPPGGAAEPEAEQGVSGPALTVVAIGGAALVAGTILGIFTIGGGVPRNWAQQVGPFVDIVNQRLGISIASVHTA